MLSATISEARDSPDDMKWSRMNSFDIILVNSIRVTFLLTDYG